MVTTALGHTPVYLDTIQTITGNKTFSGTVALGSSATATTPTTSDSSTKVATTAFVKNQGYITGITSSMVTSALGFTPANASNVQTVQDITALTPTTGTTVNYTVSNGTSLYSLIPKGNITTIGFTYTGTDGQAYTFELMLTLSTPRTIGWNSNIYWLDGEIPDLSETGVYFLAFRKVGNSSIWYGNLQGKWNP